MKKFFLIPRYFIWFGISPQGKKISSEITAHTPQLAKEYLKQQGITPITLKRKHLTILEQINHRIQASDITQFFHQLSILISSGIPIVQSCEILRQCQDKMSSRQMIHTLKNEIEIGKSLVSGLRKFPHYFDDLVCHLVNVGEQTGTLETMLKRIAHHNEKSLRLKNQFKQALFYPAILFFVAFLVSIIMLTWVIPRFAELFQHMHTPLPLFSRFVFTLSKVLRENMSLAGIPILSYMLYRYYFKTSLRFRNHIDHFSLKLPGWNTILKKLILARFMRSLATVFSAGVPITEALRMVAKTSGNEDYTKAIIALHTHISAGQQLHIAMQMSPLFPVMSIQMVKVGEESGTLERMLEKIAELYEADIDQIVSNLSLLLEPLIMIILGVLIGGLIVAMYLPIFKLGTVI